VHLQDVKYEYLSVDFYLSKSCNKSCYYCTAWTLEMRNLEVDLDFLKYTLECFKGHKTLIQLLGGEPGLIKNLKEVVDMIKEYPEFKVSILSNSLIRRKHPWVLEDPEIYYQEHLVLDFHEDKIEKLGNYDFFTKNNLNNYNIIIKTPGYFQYEKNFEISDKINHDNTFLKPYNSRSPSYDITKQESLLTRKICSKFPMVPVIDFEIKKLRHCSKKFIDGSRHFDITPENIHKMMTFELFEFESYCDTCTETIKFGPKDEGRVLKIMDRMLIDAE